MSNSASEAATADCSNTTAPPEQLCYVHCTLCDTLLAVSVPWMNMYKTVTVRCGHCSNLLPVNLRALLLGQPFPAAHLHSSSHQFFPPTAPSLNITGDQVANMTPNYPMSETTSHANHFSPSGGRGSGTTTELPRPQATNRPPEKRQRVPSAYNRFIKEEIQRLKARNPEISHREAFSAAAKNWAHFPHIHFGLMHDQTVRNAP